MHARRLIFVPVLMLLLAMGGVVIASSVEPAKIEEYRLGSASYECRQVGLFTYHFKIEGLDQGGVYPAVFADGHSNTITIGSRGSSFDWDVTENPIGAVIVNGTNGGHVFYYEPQAIGDSGLYAPAGASGEPAGLVHATFCWNEGAMPQPKPNPCDWVGEGAWSAGHRYVDRGNWATYTPYVAGSSVTLWAGQNMDAGAVHFSAPNNGSITITISMNPGWRFEDDDENVKIQGYATKPPARNPAPGLFAWKGNATGSQFSIVVPVNTFYGVHVTMEREKCPEE